MKLPSFSFLDKLVHIVEYGILASFIYLALGENKLAIYKLISLAFVISFLYGVSDEIHQYFVAGRQADIFDVVSNGIGALCFPLGLRITAYRQKKRE
jgi:VanZ family protein